MAIYSALLCCSLGAGSLYIGWRQSKRWLGGLAVLCWLASMMLFDYTTGWQYALVYTLFLPAILVWMAIIYQATTKPLQRQLPRPRALDTSLRRTGNNLLIAAVVLVAELLFSLVICLAIARLLPIAYSGQLALCIVLQPVLWALMAYHFLAIGQSLRILAFHSTLALVFGALLLL
ncbi:hypothetical protein IT774_15065 [Salinimonas marina]|uniref:Uncharacterized protein n=1 Tax=Salinimonas marina TaxID=2785918 RepID=A0A7S9DWY8_9ALTE|nr:hypothetical protein [Salinimonas marina]QPG05400.1 hypothetical protein IT774_15065 [Salinimonas marina]